jgi:Domain of unknown function (DUF4190)
VQNIPPEARVQAPAPQDHPRLSRALTLGVLSLGCGGFITGIPALILGLQSKRDIERSRGTWTGNGQAIAAIMMGFFGSIVSLAILALTLGPLAISTITQNNTPAVAKVSDVGSIHVIALANRTGTLLENLRTIVKDRRGRNVLLQTRYRRCGACDEFQSALNDTKMQAALAGTILVRVDVAVFREELEALKIETQSAPWFYKLSESLKATDGISAGEWDENIPANMAPVLDAFMRGTLKVRRDPKR